MSISLDSVQYIQGVMKVFKLLTVTNGTTFVLDSNTATGIKSWWISNATGSGKLTATLSGDTFTVANDGASCTAFLFVLL